MACTQGCVAAKDATVGRVAQSTGQASVSRLKRKAEVGWSAGRVLQPDRRPHGALLGRIKRSHLLRISTLLDLLYPGRGLGLDDSRHPPRPKSPCPAFFCCTLRKCGGGNNVQCESFLPPSLRSANRRYVPCTYLWPGLAHRRVSLRVCIGPSVSLLRVLSQVLMVVSAAK